MKGADRSGDDAIVVGSLQAPLPVRLSFHSVWIFP